MKQIQKERKKEGLVEGEVVCEGVRGMKRHTCKRQRRCNMEEIPEGRDGVTREKRSGKPKKKSGEVKYRPNRKKKTKLLHLKQVNSLQHSEVL